LQAQNPETTAGPKPIRPAARDKRDSRPKPRQNYDKNRETTVPRLGECTSTELSPESYLKVNIVGKSYKAKLDTGADANFIAKQIVDSLPVQYKNKLQRKKGHVRVADNSLVDTLGKITLPIRLRNQLFSVTFTVMEKTSEPMYLGTPFCRQNKVVLDYGKKSITVGEHCRVHSNKHYELEPYQEAIIQGKLFDEVPDSTPGLCTVFGSTTSKGLLVGNSAGIAKDGMIPVVVYNATPLKQVINKGEKLAKFEVWDENTETFPYDPESNVPEPKIANMSKNAGKRTSVNVDEHEPDIDWSKSKVNNKQKQQLKDLVKEYSDCFVNPKTKKLGLTDLISCNIETKPGTVPQHRYPYRTAPEMREKLQETVEGQVEQGLIEETVDGAWASPALLVKKPNGGLRMVIDFRALNAATVDKILRTPRLDDVLDSVGETKPKFFSVLDCTQGFHQIPLDESSRHLTAFLTSHAKYRYKVMPQGLKTASATFQALMDILLRGIQFKYVAAYIDDVICYSSTFEQHLVHLREILNRFRQANLKLHPKKCAFAVKSVLFLGHVLSTEGMSPNPEKVKAITTFPKPTKVKHVRQYLGLTGYYRKYVQSYALIARPLYDLTKKDTVFKWTDECQTAFDQLKEAIVSDKVLAFPDFKQPFILATDASKTGLGACLSQKQNGIVKPVAFAGRSFNKAESNYTTTEQELLAVVYAMQHFKVYLLGREFELHTDHSALRWLLDKKETDGRLARWVLSLQQFQYKVFHVKGKDNHVPDALSRRPYGVTKTEVDEVVDRFPDLGVIDSKQKSGIPGKQAKSKSKQAKAKKEIEDPPTLPEPGTIQCQSIRRDAQKRRERFREQMKTYSKDTWGTYNLTRENIMKEQANDAFCSQ
jgi:hypothetical protein